MQWSLCKQHANNKLPLERETCPCKKTNILRQLAAGLVLIIGEIITFHTFTIPNVNAYDMEKSLILSPGTIKMAPCRMIDNNCNIICEDLAEENIAQLVNELTDIKPCIYVNHLYLKNIKFRQSQIIKGWLSQVKQNIYNLSIESTALEEIETQALHEHPFDILVGLEIINSGLTALRRRSFSYLDLKYFALINTKNIKPLVVEELALTGMTARLETLQISRFSLRPVDMFHLLGLGVSAFKTLKTLKLIKNVIPLMKASSFRFAPYLQWIDLRKNELQEIEPGAFYGLIDNVKELNLEDNKLTTLPKGIFDNIIFAPKSIKLGNNNWECNCKLLWLQNFYINTNYINTTNPPMCKDRTFDEVEFCFNLTVTCKSYKVHPAGSYDEKHSFHLQIEDVNVKLDLYELVSETLQIQITTEGNLNYSRLIWINVDDQRDAGCSIGIKDGMVIPLNNRSPYSFSLLNNNQTLVSPFSTFCLIPSLEWDERTWIINKYRMRVILLIVSSTLILCAITSVLTFFCIRCNPVLISGNKNVVIIKHKTGKHNAPVKESERPTYLETFPNEYLTPKAHRSGNIDRDISTNISNLNIGDPYNSLYTDLKYFPNVRMMKHKRNRVTTTEEVYEYVPPLPPPNPKSKHLS